MKSYYISYKETHMHNYKGKKKERTQLRIKKISLSGDLKSWSRGTFATRFGSRVHGIKIIYIRPIPKGTGRDGRIKKMRTQKIIQIPSDATNLKISSKRPR